MSSAPETGRREERPVGQVADGSWQFGVRRTFDMSPEAAWARISSPAGLRIILGDDRLALEPGRTFEAGDGTRGEVRSVTPGVVARMSYHPVGWARPSTLQLRVMPAGERATIAFHHERLPDAAARAAMAERWGAALDALAGSGGGALR
jgi:hypothetical protein